MTYNTPLHCIPTPFHSTHSTHSYSTLPLHTPTNTNTNHHNSSHCSHPQHWTFIITSSHPTKKQLLSSNNSLPSHKKNKTSKAPYHGSSEQQQSSQCMFRTYHIKRYDLRNIGIKLEITPMYGIV